MKYIVKLLPLYKVNIFYFKELLQQIYELLCTFVAVSLLRVNKYCSNLCFVMMRQSPFCLSVCLFVLFMILHVLIVCILHTWFLVLISVHFIKIDRCLYRF